MAKNKKQGNKDESNPNAWMVTFGDLIMLLLTFFVMLLTMKSMDQKAVKGMFKDLGSYGPLDFVEGRFGGESSGIGIKGLMPKTVWIDDSEALRQAYELLKGADKTEKADKTDKDLQKQFKLTDDGRGVIVAINADSLFDSARASIGPEGTRVLDQAGKLLRGVSNDILIMGHTDNLKIRGGVFRSNLELSFYRALSVYFYLTDNCGIDPTKLGVGGYGSMMPKYSNAGPSGRAKNRRIELILRRKNG